MEKNSTERVRRCRSLKTEEQLKEVREKDKSYKAKKRSEMSEEEREAIRANDRERKAKYRENMTEEKKEYIKIETAIRIRDLRGQRTEKEKLLDNLKARKGMRALWNEGRLKESQSKQKREIEEIDIWKSYCKKGPEYKNYLRQKNPKIVSEIEMSEHNNEDEDEEVNLESWLQLQNKSAAEKASGYFTD